MNLLYNSYMGKQQTNRRSQTERTRASKEKIIQAASKFFAQEGYRGATLADIAKAANLSEPGLLHHFPSKTHLLMAVLSERDRVDRERFDPTKDGEVGDILSSYKKLVAYNQTVPGFVKLFTTLVAESIYEQHPGHDFFIHRYQETRKQAIVAVKQGQAEGVIRSDIPAEDLIIMMYAMMDGLQIQWLLEPETIDMTRIFSQFVQLFKNQKNE
ncbi:MAG: TetR/AcrR family transcriptional regulator [Anaerolineaceae bacterium]|nr:TetR/AcrR family transcriptional regulator [Anaerolineaceae bacterium]